ncbi:hypothetical protein [Edaphobacter bradus]|uniref:hypothetical protein n=1 Tax=Edaphobacter bradus TaxID=2259016 RepID=UPI0021DFBA49|nr:hypothetical protein [Edaphobacter bradus]
MDEPQTEVFIEDIGTPGTTLNAHSPIQEAHIDFLLEEEFASNPEFLTFFLSTASANVAINEKGEKFLIPASNEQWGCRSARSVTTSAGESDVLVIYRSSDPTPCRVAILIEDKIKAGFQREQAKRYRDRAKTGVAKTGMNSGLASLRRRSTALLHLASMHVFPWKVLINFSKGEKTKDPSLRVM